MFEPGEGLAGELGDGSLVGLVDGLGGEHRAEGLPHRADFVTVVWKNAQPSSAPRRSVDFTCFAMY